MLLGRAGVRRRGLRPVPDVADVRERLLPDGAGVRRRALRRVLDGAERLRQLVLLLQ
jgi:hypothetical protein